MRNTAPSARARTSKSFVASILYVLHGLALTFYVPLGLVLAPLHWTLALLGGGAIALAGSLLAARHAGASTSLLLANALWWGLAQVALPVAP